METNDKNLVKNLVLEFGNTNLKFALMSEKDSVVESYLYRVVGLNKKELLELAEQFALHLQNEVFKSYPKVERIIYSSVNKKVSTIIINTLTSFFGKQIEIIEINHFFDFSFSSNVKIFEEVGIDLLCDCEAVLTQKPTTPVFILDLGTLSKLIYLDYRDGRHVFEGVNIGPGVESMIHTMNLQAKNIHLDNFSSYFMPNERIIGNDTESAIQNGTGYMFTMMYFKTMQEIVYEFMNPSESGEYEFLVYICGGNSEIMIPLFQKHGEEQGFRISHFNDLALLGTYWVYQNNKNMKIKEEA